MRYQVFKHMLGTIQGSIRFFRMKGWEESRIKDAIIGIASEYMWDYETDMPTFNWEQLEIAVNNTMLHME